MQCTIDKIHPGKIEIVSVESHRAKLEFTDNRGQGSGVDGGCDHGGWKGSSQGVLMAQLGKWRRKVEQRRSVGGKPAVKTELTEANQILNTEKLHLRGTQRFQRRRSEKKRRFGAKRAVYRRRDEDEQKIKEGG